MEDRTKINKLLDRFGKAEAVRCNYESVWDEISKHILPDRGDFKTTRTPGVRLDRQTYDDTAKSAARKLASVYFTELTNTSTEWFGLRIKEADFKDIPEVKSYLKESTSIMLDILSSPKHKFPDSMNELLMDYVTYGNACMFITVEKNKLAFRTFHLSQIFVQENFKGQVDTVFRKYKMTIRQAVQEYGEENMSDKVKELIKKEEWDREIEMLHVVMPRVEVVKGSKKPSNLPVASFTVDLSFKHIIRESGFHEMPYVFPRFSKITGELYGTGPGWTALSTIRRLDVLQKNILIGSDYQVRPVTLVNDESVMLPVNIVPGGMIYGEFLDGGRPPITTLPVQSDFRAALEIIQQSQQAINEAFFVDQLTLPKLDRATATEVQTRKSDRLRLLSPQLIRFQSECLDVIIDRVFNILSRLGLIPDAPEFIEGKNLEIEYLGPLVKMQKAGENDAIVRTMSKIAPMLQVFPEMADVINSDATAMIIAENEGYPHKGVNSPDAVSQIRDERSQKQQQQEMLQQGLSLAEGVKNIGQSGLIDTGEEG